MYMTYHELRRSFDVPFLPSLNFVTIPLLRRYHDVHTMIVALRNQIGKVATTLSYVFTLNLSGYSSEPMPWTGHAYIVSVCLTGQ